MRTIRKINWLLLSVMVLALLLSSGTVLAQEEKLDLFLTLMPGDYHRDVKPGEESLFYLEIRNNDTSPVTNISLSSTAPEGWEIKFKPETVDYVGAKSLQTVDVSITPASAAVKDQYQINIIAEANGIRKVTSTWIMVETANSIWLWIGIVAAVLVVAGFIVVYRRFGRQ